MSSVMYGIFKAIVDGVLIGGLIIVVFGTIYKITVELLKKQKIFSVFQKKSYINRLDILKSELKKKNIPFEEKENLVITSKYTISYIDGIGTLTGKLTDKFLYLDKKEIINPFYGTTNNLLMKSIYIECRVENIEVLDVGQILFKIEASKSMKI